jgi:hypothetical protein
MRCSRGYARSGIGARRRSVAAHDPAAAYELRGMRCRRPLTRARRPDHRHRTCVFVGLLLASDAVRRFLAQDEPAIGLKQPPARHLGRPLRSLALLVERAVMTMPEGCVILWFGLTGRSSNGKTAASGAAYRGSSPCLPATSFEPIAKGFAPSNFSLIDVRSCHIGKDAE